MKALLQVLIVAIATATQYEPTWESLDQRPTPQWWSKMKFGVSLHWGVYSVPAFSDPTGSDFCAEWFWNYAGGPDGPNTSPVGQFWDRVYGKNFAYPDFAASFRAEFYNDAKDWAQLFADNGVQLALLTSKHHDGYELWPSPNSYNWNSMAVGPKQDLVGAFMNATRAEGMQAGLYHSVFEWFNPLYRGPNSSLYVTEKLIPDLHTIVNTYKPAMLLMDGEWEQPSDFWQTKPFLAWLFNDSPVKDTIVVNDRWGSECRGHHPAQAVFTCENGMFSSFCDGTNAANGSTHAWSYWATQGRSWALSRAEGSDYYRKGDFFIPLLVDNVVDNGMLILNFGPAADGTIPPMQQATLKEIGSWLKVNGEAIYNSTLKTGQRRELVNGDTFSLRFQGETVVKGVAPGTNTSVITYLGKTSSAADCQQLCQQDSGCIAYTWYSPDDSQYKEMCYGRNDTTWNVSPEPGAASAKREQIRVQYVKHAEEASILYAFFTPFIANSTLNLKVPARSSSSLHSASLLGYGPITSEHAGNVVQVQLPNLAVDELPCQYMYALKLELS